MSAMPFLFVSLLSIAVGSSVQTRRIATELASAVANLQRSMVLLDRTIEKFR